jgi:hypothetical protein
MLALSCTACRCEQIHFARPKAHNAHYFFLFVLKNQHYGSLLDGT